jgi:thiol-disulfide isomerase/thioredoxin
LFCCLLTHIFAFEWLTDYGEAAARASEENKPVMALLMRQTCPYCRMLLDETLVNDTIVKEIERNYVPLIIDVEKDPEKTVEIGLNPRAVPATYIIEGDRVTATLIGYRPPMEFMRFLQRN